MDLGAWSNLVAIIGGVFAGLSAIVGGSIWVGGWMQRRQSEGKHFSETDKRVGTLADNSTKAVRDLEKKFDERHERIERKFDEHAAYDHERFDVVTETLSDIQRTLGRIEGSLGNARRH